MLLAVVTIVHSLATEHAIRPLLSLAKSLVVEELALALGSHPAHDNQVNKQLEWLVIKARQ